MRNKIIASLAAGAILVGAGFVTTIVSAPDAAIAQEGDGSMGEGRGIIPRSLEFLANVLDGLVSDGDLSQEDADLVIDAVNTAVEEAKAEHEAIREAIKEALEDGELTLEEAEVLPDDHPWFSERFDEAWEDGVLTTQEIRENTRHPRRDAFRHGARFGALLDDGGIDVDEYNALPEDHPLKSADIGDALDDDLITPDELREIWQQYKESMNS